MQNHRDKLLEEKRRIEALIAFLDDSLNKWTLSTFS